METVHHLELPPQVLLGQVVEHPRVHQALHEEAAVLREAQAGQPLVADPLVVHVPVRQRLRSGEARSVQGTLRKASRERLAQAAFLSRHALSKATLTDDAAALDHSDIICSLVNYFLRLLNLRGFIRKELHCDKS